MSKSKLFVFSSIWWETSFPQKFDSNVGFIDSKTKEGKSQLSSLFDHCNSLFSEQLEIFRKGFENIYIFFFKKK